MHGAANLLREAVGVKPGDRVLLVEEPAARGFYCPSVGAAIEQEALALGARVHRARIDPEQRPVRIPPAVAAQMAKVEHAVFANRLSDYSRFESLPGECSRTQCYALDAAMLDSAFCTASHSLLTQLLRRLEAHLLAAREWRITCALGTQLSGVFEQTGSDDFSLSLFPVTTFRPVSCATATGTVVLSRWLMPGGAPKMPAQTLMLDDIVTAEVRGGLLAGVHGHEPAVAAVEAHYDRVSGTLGVNRNRVHSWHAGINPLTRWPTPASHSLERWGAVSFGSPRYLHFHTCGDEPPGEVTWSVFNPTVTVDGEALWRDGEFVWLQRPENVALISSFDGAERLLAPAESIGL